MMASTILPLYSDPFYSYNIDIDNEAFRFTFRWNQRAEQWFMSITDSDDTVIIYNVALVATYPILRQFSLEKPVGEFYLVPIDESELWRPIPDPRNLFKTHFLVYEDFISESE